MKEQVIESDVLCIGGGIAGLMAAIRASELGASVVVAEKANTLRSGAAATGNDHFLTYMPDVHGPNVDVVMKAIRQGQMGGKMVFLDRDVLEAVLLKSMDVIKLWDAWGIPMQYQGKYHFSGHAFPGKAFCFLKYQGRDQKLMLTKEAKRRGIRIVNRVMGLELIGDGRIHGALGLNVREDEMVFFKAKSVILGTGTVSRLFPGITPGLMANSTRPGCLSGDGRAMAFRAGASLVNVELPASHAGPKYFSRSGQGTWMGLVKNRAGQAMGPFLSKPDRHYSDIITEVNKNMYLEHARSGKGPLYMDCRGITDDDYEYLKFWLVQEGCSALTDYMEKEGIDPRKHPVEFTTYGLRDGGGWIGKDFDGQADLPGLFSAGDEIMSNGIAEAAATGWMAGEAAAKYSQKAGETDVEKGRTQAEAWQNLIGDIQKRTIGPDWREANVALQQTMVDYAGLIRSEHLLEAGLEHLGRLSKKVRSSLVARNPHEISRAVELLNLFDLGEILFHAALERKETRGLHVRSDYTYTNPLMENLLAVKKGPSGPVFEWREVRR